MNVRLSNRSLLNILALALVGISLVLLVDAIAGASPPKIKTDFGGATVDISADKAWSLFSGDCLTIRWNLERIKSIYIDGQGKIGWGEIEYCPSYGAASPQFEISAQNGTLQVFTLDIHYLPTELLICLLFLAIILSFSLALYYFCSHQLDKPFPIRVSLLLALAVAAIGCLLAFATDIFSVRQVLRSLGEMFGNPSWQLFGLVLAGIIYIPLLAQSVRHGIKVKARHDFVVIVGFLVFLLLLYLPFGIESIGHWEEWVFNAYLEGRPSRVSTELVSRFWILVPNALAYIITPDSFVGYHLVNLLMFWGKMILFYGILRNLKLAPLLAFMTTVLFLVYPVNSGLMSLRSFGYTFNILSLLAAVFLTLSYLEHSNRVRLLGIWLALLFNVASAEIAYVLIVIIPILWWWRRIRWSRRNFNLTVIWYLFPAMKIAYLLALILISHDFYGSHLFDNSERSAEAFIEMFSHYAGVLSDVIHHTFVSGWQNALISLGQNEWIVSTVCTMVLCGAIAAYLAHRTSENCFLSVRRLGIATGGGLLLVLASVGVLMWLERYNSDLWRMYVYVPIGAAIVVLSLLILVTVPISKIRVRKAIMIGLWLLLMLPAYSRLILQHEHYQNSANKKTKILLQMVEQASAFNPEANVIMLTDRGYRELAENHIHELWTNMLDGAFYVLYQDGHPRSAILCSLEPYCTVGDTAMGKFRLIGAADYSKIVFFRLHDDLTVELLRDLPPELSSAQNGSYDPDRLIDTSAPLPPRAITMLVAATPAVADT